MALAAFLAGFISRVTADEPKPEDGVVVFAFGSPADAEGWNTLTDVVMGGRSRAGVEATDDGVLRFTGDLSRERTSAGFAQVRSPEFSEGLPGMGGVRVRLRGDGKTYMMRVTTVDSAENVYYRADFSTRTGEWEVHDLAFADFKPYFRGFWVAHGPLRAEAIKSLGFMIADRQTGPFSLEIDWICAVTAAELATAAEKT